MKTVEDEVRSVVLNFVANNELFTALDVSNKVKLSMPFARHREVRDLVRNMFTTDIEPAGWARTPINVTLADGSQTEALLYHSLSDSWDLDTKYDDQKRQQASITSAPVATFAPVATTAPPVSVPAPQSAPTVAVKSLPMRDQWMQLFNTQPSLFPLK